MLHLVFEGFLDENDAFKEDGRNTKFWAIEVRLLFDLISWLISLILLIFFSFSFSSDDMALSHKLWNLSTTWSQQWSQRPISSTWSWSVAFSLHPQGEVCCVVSLFRFLRLPHREYLVNTVELTAVDWLALTEPVQVSEGCKYSSEQHLFSWPDY